MCQGLRTAPPSPLRGPRGTSFEWSSLGQARAWDQRCGVVGVRNHCIQDTVGSLAGGCHSLGFRMLSPPVFTPQINLILSDRPPLSFSILPRGSELLRRLTGPNVTSKSHSCTSQLGHLGWDVASASTCTCAGWERQFLPSPTFRIGLLAGLNGSVYGKCLVRLVRARP